VTVKAETVCDLYYRLIWCCLTSADRKERPLNRFDGVVIFLRHYSAYFCEINIHTVQSTVEQTAVITSASDHEDNGRDKCNITTNMVKLQM